MRKFLLILFFITSASVSFAQSQKFEYTTVSSSGIAPTENDAIKEAIIEAVSQVYGVDISARSQLETLQLSVSDNSGTDELIAEKFQESISIATRGIVSSYTIISSEKVERGISVKISAKIVKYKSPADANRIRVALIPFTPAQKDYKGLEDSKILGSDLSRIATQSLNSGLTSSRKFTILDREYMEQVKGELNFIANETASVEELCRSLAAMGADYILVGTIESFTLKENQIKLKSGTTAKVKEGGIAIGIRLLDAATRQVKFSDVVNLKAKIPVGGTGSDVVEICNQFAELLSPKITEAIYPIRVVAVNDDEVVLNQGGTDVVEGTQYEMFALGAVLIDPYTKESLGRKEKKCGMIEIVRSKPKTSDAKILESTSSIEEILKENEIVCRPLKIKEEKQVKEKEPASKRKDIW